MSSRREKAGRVLKTGGTVAVAAASAVGAGLLVFAVTHWVEHSPSFGFRWMDVDGLETVPVEEIRALAAVAPGTPLLDVDVEAIDRSIEAHPRILWAVVERVLPDRIHVRVQERTPIAQVQALGWYELDGTGTVLGPVRPGFDRLPRFSGVAPNRALAPGARLDHPAVAPLLDLVRALREPPLRAAKLDRRLSLFLVSDDGDLTIPVDSSPCMLLLGREQWVERMNKLARVESARVVTPKDVAWLDLRFRDQVVAVPAPVEDKALAKASTGA
jgi:cell division septal protein FtsQ